MQCKDTQPHISHRYFTCVLLFNTPSTLNYSLSGVYKKKKEKKKVTLQDEKDFLLYIISFVALLCKLTFFLAMFIFMSVFTGLLYYMWINRLWCHILTFNCVTFMFKVCTAILFGDKHKTLLLMTWRKKRLNVWRRFTSCKLLWITLDVKEYDRWFSIGV